MRKKRKVGLEKLAGDAEKAMQEISEDFGHLSFLDDQEQMYVMSTIIPSFNRASLIGGLPGGSIVELHGPNQGGKTVLGVGLLVSAQKLGFVTGLIDSEGSFKDKSWPEALGLNLKSVLYPPFKTFEEAADKVNENVNKFVELQKSGRHKDRMMIWLVDSLTGLVPQAVLEGGVGKKNFGLHALLVSDWLKILNANIKGTNITVIFINQERVNVGAKQFERKWKSSCGEALQYYAHFRVRVRSSSKVKSGENIVGREHTFQIEKNKLSACDEIGKFYTSSGKDKAKAKGWDMNKTYLEEGLTTGILKKKNRRITCDYDDETKVGMYYDPMAEKIGKDGNLAAWIESEFKRRNELEK